MNLKYCFLDPTEIIETDDFKVVENFLRNTGRRHIGWHYIIDLTWIYMHAKNWQKGTKILDAGGGHGPTQFLLAEMGFDVTNIDLEPARLRYPYRKRYCTKISKLRSFSSTEYSEHLQRVRNYRAMVKKIFTSVTESVLMKDILARRYVSQHERWRHMNGFSSVPVGRICWVVGNLCEMPEVQSSSFDAVVSLSALEHIPLEFLPAALKEIDRVLKPTAHRAITTSSTEKECTWFHEPSKGLCFSEYDLGELFHAENDSKNTPKAILENYIKSSYLQRSLANFYYKSGDNGMPWGKWNPTYIPVGICS